MRYQHTPSSIDDPHVENEKVVQDEKQLWVGHNDKVGWIMETTLGAN